VGYPLGAVIGEQEVLRHCGVDRAGIGDCDVADVVCQAWDVVGGEYLPRARVCIAVMASDPRQVSPTVPVADLPAEGLVLGARCCRAGDPQLAGRSDGDLADDPTRPPFVEAVFGIEPGAFGQAGHVDQGPITRGIQRRDPTRSGNEDRPIGSECDIGDII